MISGQTATILQTESMADSITKLKRLTLHDPRLIYEFPGGTILNSYWCLHNNTIGSSLSNIPIYNPIQDWSKGITIGFDFYINRNGPNSVYRPLIYIGGDPNNTSLPHFALVHLANTGFSYIFYINGVATNQSFVVLYDGRIVINILPSGVVNLYIASALAYSNNLNIDLTTIPYKGIWVGLYNNVSWYGGIYDIKIYNDILPPEIVFQ
jgi:hypothetical protein